VAADPPRPSRSSIATCADGGRRAWSVGMLDEITDFPPQGLCAPPADNGQTTMRAQEVIPTDSRDAQPPTRAAFARPQTHRAVV